MSSVRIVCDSTADLGQAFLDEHDVRVVPLKVIFGDEVFEDGVTLSAAAFYARMGSSTVHPRTSQPTPAEFEQVFAELTADGSSVVCTTISAELSGTYASATQARAALADRDIHVLDTRSVSVGHHAAVRAAVTAAEAGGGADEVEEAIRDLLGRQRVLFTVETLEFLRRGGRIGGARALLGSVLDVKPILEISDGHIEPVDRVRTYQRALDRILGFVEGAAAQAGGVEVTIGHADRQAVADDLARRTGAIAGAGGVHVIDVGPVIGSHAGPGAIGVGFVPLPPRA